MIGGLHIRVQADDIRHSSPVDLVDDVGAGEGEKVVVALELLGVVLELVIVPIVIAVKLGSTAEVLLLRTHAPHASTLPPPYAAFSSMAENVCLCAFGCHVLLWITPPSDTSDARVTNPAAFTASSSCEKRQAGPGGCPPPLPTCPI